MIREARLVLVCLASCATHIAAQETSVTTNPPVVAADLTVVVTVHDARTGLPVAGAPVQLVGSDETASTDVNGQASLHRASIGSTVRAWTQPPGYTADDRDVPRVSDWNLVELWVIPDALLQSPLISSTAGGSHTFDVNIGFNHLWMRVDVPADTFTEDVRIGLSPMPVWGMHGLEGRDAPIARAQLSLTNADGRVVVPTAKHPVRVTFRPWAFRDIDWSASTPSEIRIAFHDPSTKCFRSQPISVTLDPQAGTLSFSLQDWMQPCQWYVWLHDHDWLGGTATSSPSTSAEQPTLARSPSSLTVEEAAVECRSVFHCPVSCGQFGGSAWIGEQQGRSVSIGGDLAAGLRGLWRDGANVAVAKLSGEVGVDLRLTLDGTLEWAGVTSVTGKIDQGPGASSACFSGASELMLVWTKKVIKADGVEIGTIARPSASFVKRSLVHDPACAGGSQCERTMLAPPSIGRPCQ